MHNLYTVHCLPRLIKLIQVLDLIPISVAAFHNLAAILPKILDIILNRGENMQNLVSLSSSFRF